MGRHKSKEPLKFIGVKLTERMVASLDRLTAELQEAHPGAQVTRSHAIRHVVSLGLATIEGHG